MDITITVSEKTAKNIQIRAESSGKKLDDFVENFVEENFQDNSGEPDGETRSFMRLQGMFSSGLSDTSERMSEILYTEDFDPAQGFGTDK